MQITIDSNVVAVVIDRKLDQPLGTGFVFLRNDWVVTAKHVVLEHDLPRRELDLTFYLGEKVSASVLAIHPELDLAILQTSVATACKRPLHPSYDELTGKSGVMYFGYCPSRTNPDGGLAMLADHATVYVREKRIRQTGEFVLEFDSATIEGGFSGGPVLGEGGSVVGVIIQRYDAGACRARATSIRGLMDGIKFDVIPDWRIGRAA